jgi:hypothetical protein
MYPIGLGPLPHQTLAPPDPHDTDALAVHSIYDAERRPDEFTQPRLVELGDHSAACRKLGQLVQASQDLTDQALTDVGRRLRDVPVSNRLKIVDGRLGKKNPNGHSAEPEPASGILHGHFAAFFQIEEAGNELALFLRRLEFGQSLDNGDASTMTRQKDRSTGLARPPNHLAGVHLQVPDRDYILRELDCGPHQDLYSAPVIRCRS